MARLVVGIPAHVRAPFAKWFVQTAFVGVAYYLAARLGLLMQLPGTNASPVWPPSGIGLAVILLCGYRVWPGIAAGAFLANLLTLPHTTAGLVASTGICVGNTLEHVVALSLVRWTVGSDSPFDRAAHVFRFVLTAAVACAVASTNGATSLWLAGIIPGTIYGSVWFTWWLGDISGMLVLAPAIYCWSRQPWIRFSVPRMLELAGLWGVTAGSAELLFGGWFASPVIESLPYILVPALLWGAFRFGPRETSTTAVLLSVIAIGHTWLLMHDAPESVNSRRSVFAPFIGPAMSPNDSLLMLQVFVCAVTVTAATLAGAATERRKAVDALRASEQRLTTIIEHAPMAMLVVNRRGEILMANPRTAMLFGYDRSELIGQKVERIVSHTSLAHWPALVDCYLEEGHGHRKDGQGIPMDVELSPITLQGEPVVLACVVDQTEHKQLQQREKELENVANMLSLREVVGGLAHELSTPLQCIVTWAGVVERMAPSPEQQREAIAGMSSAAKQAGAIVHKLRSAIIRSETVDQAVSLNEVISDTLRSLRKDITGVMTKLAGPLPLVSADPLQLQIVVSNLIRNAHQAGGPVTVTTSVRDGQVACAVEDCGPGFDVLPERLFEPFYTTKAGGLGMGLTITQAIVRRYGGRITATNQDHGARFEFTLPSLPAA